MVVKYEIQDKVAILEAIQNGFTRSADALQKSALIKTEETGVVIVVDRTVRNDITDFFRGFFNVRRRYNSNELNTAVSRAVASTIKAHRDDLPTAVRTRWRESLSTLASQGGDFEAESFASKIFGAHSTAAVKATFEGELKKANVSGEVFMLDPGVLNDTGPVRLKTIEGVTIYTPQGARDTVTWADDKNGFTVITIRTAKLLEEP